MRLIDADEVDYENILCSQSQLHWLHSIVEMQPTVDAVVLVLCKDCNHSKLPSLVTQRYGVPGTLTCHNPKSPCNRRNVNQNGFCPFGERKKGR